MEGDVVEQEGLIWACEGGRGSSQRYMTTMTYRQPYRWGESTLEREVRHISIHDAHFDNISSHHYWRK